MDPAGQLARDPGIATRAITMGLFDEHGPAQRLYGYRPDHLTHQRSCQPTTRSRTSSRQMRTVVPKAPMHKYTDRPLAR
jgi:hypothetical protein